MISLVTGGAGLIGSNLVDYLLKQGHEVICVDHESAECNDKFYWNGITTLQWSKICNLMINDFESYDVLNIPTSNRVSKYELLEIIKDVFNKDIEIKKNSKVESERCLKKTDGMPHLDIKTQLKELKDFYYDD